MFLFTLVVSFKYNIFCFVWMTRTYQVLQAKMRYENLLLALKVELLSV